jgi:hypothetical protein
VTCCVLPIRTRQLQGLQAGFGSSLLLTAVPRSTVWQTCPMQLHITCGPNLNLALTSEHLV